MASPTFYLILILKGEILEAPKADIDNIWSVSNTITKKIQNNQQLIIFFLLQLQWAR